MNLPMQTSAELDSVIVVLTATGGCLLVSDSLRIDFAPRDPERFHALSRITGYNDYFGDQRSPQTPFLRDLGSLGLLVLYIRRLSEQLGRRQLNSDIYYYASETATSKCKGWIKVLRD